MNVLLSCSCLSDLSSSDRSNVIIVSIVCGTILLLLFLKIVEVIILKFINKGEKDDDGINGNEMKPELTEEQKVQKEERDAQKDYFAFCYKMVEKRDVDDNVKRECWEILKNHFNDGELQQRLKSAAAQKERK